MPIYALDDRIPLVHSSAYIHPDAVIIGAVIVGAEASVWPGAVLRGDYGEIHVGARTSVQDGTIIHTTAEWPTRIANDCVVGHRAHLEGCVVEEFCLVGSGSIVLNRASIESDSVVPAGAVVREGMVVPSGHLAVGVPAACRPLARTHRPWVEESVATYVRNAARYAHGMREMGDELSDVAPRD